jgi:hypothetical protein
MEDSNQKKSKQPTDSRVHHFMDWLLIEALEGMAKRFGAGVIDADDLELQRLIEENVEKNKVEDSYFWGIEILKEFRERRSADSISWPPKK